VTHTESTSSAHGVRAPSAEGRPKVDFLIVGSPRSGTTLVQRLACELPGVVMPPETHFFSTIEKVAGSDHFPLEEPELRRVVEGYVAMRGDDALGIEPEELLQSLGSRHLMDVFTAIVLKLSGPGEVHGEKTPNHLRWWRPISKVSDSIRFIVVVRDPRAVVSSNLGAPWADAVSVKGWRDYKHLLFAYRWVREEAQAWDLARALGGRVLTLRYEDVVANPSAARDRIAQFLGLSNVHASAPESIVRPWESWKREALGPITDKRTEAWRHEGLLSASAAEEVAALCWVGMSRHHYAHGPLSVTAAALWRVPRARVYLRPLHSYESRTQRKIDAYVL
jgi:Sulfotransferase family